MKGKLRFRVPGLLIVSLRSLASLRTCGQSLIASYNTLSPLKVLSDGGKKKLNPGSFEPGNLQPLAEYSFEICAASLL